MSVFTSVCTLIGSNHQHKAQHHENLATKMARLDQSGALSAPGGSAQGLGVGLHLHRTG